MKSVLILLCCLLPFLVNAQHEPTIKFSEAQTWEELLNEAKIANKPIFIDAFTTWCGPCKKMDQEVFPEKSVAEFLNQHFICLRIQMDSTKNDNAYLASWRTKATQWKKYITAYPCYMFFTPMGVFAGREFGYFEPAKFLSLLKKNIDPDGNYLATLQKFREGRLNKYQLLGLSYWARKNMDTVANQVASHYKRTYMEHLPVDSLLNPETNQFISEFLDVFTPHDKIIKFMFMNPEYCDSLFHRNDYSRKAVDHLIALTYIKPNLPDKSVASSKNPNWPKFYKRIEEDFGSETAERVVLKQKINWAFDGGKFEEFTRLEFQRIDKYGMDTTEIGRAFFNNMIFEVVYKKVNDLALMKRAATYMRRVTDLDKKENIKNTSHIDTYAVLLYKAGDRSKALEVEKLALEMAQKKNDTENIPYYEEVIRRMKRGEQIWKLDL